MKGWIYVMTNPAVPGLVKIGMSSKELAVDRVKELSAETSAPAPFKVEYQALVENEVAEERKIHSFFSKSWKPGKELFELSVSEAIVQIRRQCDIKYEDYFFKSPEAIAREEADIWSFLWG
jgi:hypothetical protein